MAAENKFCLWHKSNFMVSLFWFPTACRPLLLLLMEQIAKPNYSWQLSTEVGNEISTTSLEWWDDDCWRCISKCALLQDFQTDITILQRLLILNELKSIHRENKQRKFITAPVIVLKLPAWWTTSSATVDYYHLQTVEVFCLKIAHCNKCLQGNWLVKNQLWWENSKR